MKLSNLTAKKRHFPKRTKRKTIAEVFRDNVAAGFRMARSF